MTFPLFLTLRSTYKQSPKSFYSCLVARILASHKHLPTLEPYPPMDNLPLIEAKTDETASRRQKVNEAGERPKKKVSRSYLFLARSSRMICWSKREVISLAVFGRNMTSSQDRSIHVHTYMHTIRKKKKKRRLFSLVFVFVLQRGKYWIG